MNRYTESEPTNISTNVLSNLMNPFSDWYNLRVAEMAGYDYVFAPVSLCDLLNRASLEDFNIHLHTLLGSDADRTILISYENTDYQHTFSRVNLAWEGGSLTHSSVAELSGTAQIDFIELLFEHSEKLLSSDECS